MQQRLLRTCQRAALAVALLAPVPAFAQAHFDNLPNGDFQPTPLGYLGHNWYHGNDVFGVGTQLEYSTLSFCRSQPNCAYNAFGNSELRIEAPTQNATDLFTFQGWLAGIAYPDFGFGPTNGASKVLAEGFIGTSTTAAYSFTFDIANAFTFIDLSAIGVNKLMFTPLDANGNSLTNGSTFLQGYVFMDDVSFGTPATSTVPEPSSWALMTAGLAGVVIVARKRRLV